METQRPLINLQEQRDIGQVLNVTFDFLRLTYKYIFKDLLLIAGPFFIVGGLMSALQNVDMFSSGSIVEGSHPVLFLMLSLFFTVIGSVISYAIVGNYLLSYKENGSFDFNVSEIRRVAWGRFFKLFLTFIVFYLSIFLGFILLIIPGIYFAIANYLGPINVMLNKDAGIINTFGESRRLLQNNWWRTFGLTIIVTLIVYLFTLVFGIPNLIYAFLYDFHSSQGSDSEKYRIPLILFRCFSQLAYCFAIPISVISTVVYYYSLKEEKDKIGLMQKIDEFGKKETDTKINEGSY